ncbi:hypothetical protein O7632_24870 [Solwaraspora sp. WMMD406]|uniref:hypothetical protein n=1 Tax=Solwaraspora sp. WMMD406 TaxID=3016095 RepID=UPI0024179F04|nr:hypothetical protein [Solwaraspora sp. WMMD406]MDG4767299.1 hypothetical protein [Solwaraspora sp. WMMD406]
MIYTTSGVGPARRWTQLWPAATAGAVAALIGLLLLALVGCGPAAGGFGGDPDADAVTGSAGLGGVPGGVGGLGPGDGGQSASGDGDGTGDEADGDAANEPDGNSGNGNSGDGSDDGGGSGDAGDGGGPEPEVTPAAEDCVTYDPANLTIEEYGDAWRMRDGGHAIKVFATKADAEDGVKVARNWTTLCFIGRGNDRADRYRYIVTYFTNPSGLPLGLAPRFDCITYDPTTLAVYGPDGDGWGLRAGATPLLFLASAADAARARIVAAGNTRLCVIGHGNDQPDPSRFQLEHWRQ